MISNNQLRAIQATSPQYVDLCFLLDITYSMEKWIASAKSIISKILQDVSSKNPELSTIRYAFVGYADFGSNVQFVIEPFTEDFRVVEQTIANCTTMNGIDYAEDVAGGLQKVIELDWNSFTKVLIHIGDAPGHGKFMHNIPKCDRFIDTPEEPVKKILKELVSQKVDYFFMEITKHTNVMTDYFKKNMDLFNPQDMNPKVSITVMKDLIQTGSDSANTENLVFLQKISDAILTAHSSSLQRSTRTAKKMIKETNSLDESWKKLKAKKPRKGKVLSFALHSYDKTEKEIIDFFVSGKPSIIFGSNIDIVIDDKVFAKGSQRNAYKALDTEFDVKLVAKSFIENLTIDEKLENYQEVVKTHFVAKELGILFNRQKDAIKFGIHFVDVKMVVFENDDGEIIDCYTLEPFIEGEYQKLFSNTGVVSCIKEATEKPEVMALLQTSQTFSHWTFEKTYRKLLVTDIQGVKYRMTDPAISSENQLFGETDPGVEGFDLFFRTHYCNEACLKLGLNHPYGANFMNNPVALPKTLSNTIDHVEFCSGYCCGNYIEFKTNEKAEDLGSIFCDLCKKRNNIREQKVCKKKGCSLKFEIERWYWMSRGKSTPSKCHLHRGSVASELRDWKKNKTLPYGALYTLEQMNQQIAREPELKKLFDQDMCTENKPELFDTVTITNLPLGTNEFNIRNDIIPNFFKENKVIITRLHEEPLTFSIKCENERIALEAFQSFGSYIYSRRLIYCKPLQNKTIVELDKNSINIQLLKYPTIKCKDILQYFKNANIEILDKYYEENKFANFTFSDPSIAKKLVSNGIPINGTKIKVVYKKVKLSKESGEQGVKKLKKQIEVNDNIDYSSLHITWTKKDPNLIIQEQDILQLLSVPMNEIINKKFIGLKSFMQITFKSESIAAELELKKTIDTPNFKIRIDFKKIPKEQDSSKNVPLSNSSKTSNSQSQKNTFTINQNNEQPTVMNENPKKMKKQIEVNDNIDYSSLHISWTKKNPNVVIQKQDILQLLNVNKDEIVNKKFNGLKSFMQITFKSESIAAELELKKTIDTPNFKIRIDFKTIPKEQDSNLPNTAKTSNAQNQNPPKKGPKEKDSSKNVPLSNASKTSNSQRNTSSDNQNNDEMVLVFEIGTLLKFKNNLPRLLENPNIQIRFPEMKIEEMNDEMFELQDELDEFKVTLNEESNNLTLRTLKVCAQVSSDFKGKKVMFVTDDEKFKTRAEKHGLKVINTTEISNISKTPSTNPPISHKTPITSIQQPQPQTHARPVPVPVQQTLQQLRPQPVPVPSHLIQQTFVPQPVGPMNHHINYESGMTMLNKSGTRNRQ